MDHEDGNCSSLEKTQLGGDTWDLSGGPCGQVEKEPLRREKHVPTFFVKFFTMVKYI